MRLRCLTRRRMHVSFAGGETLSLLAERFARWEEKQKKSNRQLRSVPGLRNIFLFLSFGLIPAFLLYAWFDSNANNLQYTWLSVAAFVCMYSYGMIAILDLGYRRDAAYLASGFLIIAFANKLIGNNFEHSLIIWGMLIGWFSGVASISCIMWLRLRKEWNEKNPEKRC